MRLFGKIGKFIKKAAVAVGRTALASATGGASEPAIRAGKALAVNLKAQRIKKIEPMSVRAVLAKSSVPKPAVSIDSTALTMPGGAPLKKTRKRRIVGRGDDFYANGPKKAVRRQVKKNRAASKGVRKAPKGGLDLKAIAALYRAQGKPGKWIDFVKKNPIRKAG